MTAREVIKRLESAGWYEDRQRGGHKVFKHPTKPGLVIVSVHGSKDIPTGTLHKIFKDAGLTLP